MKVFFQLILKEVNQKKIEFYFSIILLNIILLLRLTIGLVERKYKYEEGKISDIPERGENIRN